MANVVAAVASLPSETVKVNESVADSAPALA